MLNVYIEGILVYLACFNCKFNGFFKLAGTVKIRGFDTFSRCKSREGGCRVNYGSTLKLADRRRLYGVYKYYFTGY